MKKHIKIIKAKKRLPLSRFSVPYNGVINIVYAENEFMAARQVTSNFRKYRALRDNKYFVDNRLLYS